MGLSQVREIEWSFSKMFVLVILGFAAVTESVPVTHVTQVTDDATPRPKLQLAFLVEDVEYQPSHTQKLQQLLASSGKKNFAGRSRILREEDNEIEDFFRRKRRSPQTQQNQVLPITNIASQDDQLAVESVSTSRVPAAALANILKIAGAGKTPIVRSGGYGGRKRRSPMDSSSADFDSLETSENLPSLSPNGGGPHNRRKRSAQKVPVHANAHQYGLVDNPEVGIAPHGKYGDLQRILALSGARPQPISRGVSYGRRKRSPQDLTNEIITNEIQTGSGLVKNVAVEAVKIKSHGNYGNIAQLYDAGANSKNVVVNGRYGRRKRQDFIPFNVNEERKVKTLKIEQNDFLALPKKLQIENADSSDRQVRKRHFTANQ